MRPIAWLGLIVGPSSIPFLGDGDMLDTAWIGFASRHAGPALPASTSA